MLRNEWLHPQVGFTVDCSQPDLNYCFTVCSDQPIPPKELVLRSQVIGYGRVKKEFLECTDLMYPRQDPPDQETKYRRNAFFNGSLILNLGSFFNHDCAPNCNYILDNVTEEVMFFSIRKLEPQQELTISYYHFPIDCLQVKKKL